MEVAWTICTDIDGGVGGGVVATRFEHGVVTPVAAVHGALPGLIQEVPLAERYGFVFLQHAAPGDEHADGAPYVYHTDCQWVRDSWLAGPASCAGPWHIGACLWKQVFRLADDLGSETILEPEHLLP